MNKKDREGILKAVEKIREAKNLTEVYRYCAYIETELELDKIRFSHSRNNYLKKLHQVCNSKNKSTQDNSA